MRFDAYATEPHYFRAIAPILDALPAENRGQFFSFNFEYTPDAWAVSRGAPNTSNPVIVAGYRDLQMCGGRPAIMVAHGAGQTYLDIGDHPSYAGGRSHENVILFISPGKAAASKWAAKYPQAKSIAVGCPAMDHHFQSRARGNEIAVTFGWGPGGCPEMRSGAEFFMPGVAELSKRHEIIGTGHPRIIDPLAPLYRNLGIEVVRDPDEVLRRASLVVADNTSLAWEAASLGIPLVWLNIPEARRDVEHGMRWWKYANSGIQCDEPRDILSAVESALADPVHQRNRRERAVKAVYQYTDGRSTKRTVDAILSLAV
ncbi:MAG: hypothetical protein ACR2M4_03170 [Actinomycetota bacterium]